MIFRLSQKLGRKIGVTPPECIPMDTNPLADWTAHLFTAQRAQYIIITNTPSLYSTVMYGRGITTDSRFLEQALSCMREFLAHDGNGLVFEKLIVPDTRRVIFSRSLNRSVTGSMNDLVSQAKLYLAISDESPFDISFKLNETPLSYLKYLSPREALRALSTKQLVCYREPEATENLSARFRPWSN